MNPYIITETSKARVCFVNVPGDATDFVDLDDTMFNHLIWNQYDLPPKRGYAIIPDGDFKILGRLSQVSEEQAAGIVDTFYDSFEDENYFVATCEGGVEFVDDPFYALKSVARSLNIPEDQDPVVLVEKSKNDSNENFVGRTPRETYIMRKFK